MTDHADDWTRHCAGNDVPDDEPIRAGLMPAEAIKLLARITDGHVDGPQAREMVETAMRCLEPVEQVGLDDLTVAIEMLVARWRHVDDWPKELERLGDIAARVKLPTATMPHYLALIVARDNARRELCIAMPRADALETSPHDYAAGYWGADVADRLFPAPSQWANRPITWVKNPNGTAYDARSSDGHSLGCVSHVPEAGWCPAGWWYNTGKGAEGGPLNGPDEAKAAFLKATGYDDTGTI